MHRRNFIQVCFALMGAAALPPTPAKSKRGITLKFHDSVTFYFGENNEYPHTYSLPHRNAKEDTYDVFEDGFFLGTLRIPWYECRISCLRDRSYSPCIEFETFFGLVFTDDNDGLGYEFGNGYKHGEAVKHPDSVIKKIARRMNQKAIDKMLDMMEKFKKHTTRLT